MLIHTDQLIYNPLTREHLYHNDLFLRAIAFEDVDGMLREVQFIFYHGKQVLQTLAYPEAVISARLNAGQEELGRYRASSLYRILGTQVITGQMIMDESFQFFSVEPCDQVVIRALDTRWWETAVQVTQYQSQNTYLFPLRGTFLVSDTYPSINSHRWCRNSEFAIDIGCAALEGTVENQEVYAACGGNVIDVFDGIEDTTDDTDLSEIERVYGEPVRIDGNHVLIQHPHGECTLYSHLKKGSVAVSPGQKVDAGDYLGRVGSSGSSWLPHLHFHAMLDGIHGQGIPIRFQNLVSYFDEPCDLSETTNVVKTTE